MLGSSLASYLKIAGFKTIIQGYKIKTDINIDMTDQKSVSNILDLYSPDIIINLVCLSDVEENERNTDLAYSLNVKPVENITHWIKNNNEEVKFIHISTDHVYNKDGLNKEEDVRILNGYASSKFEAEKVASKVNSLILRTNFFGKSKLQDRPSFTDWLDISINENRFPINLFKDVFFSPLSITTLSKMIHHVLGYRHTGIFNLGSRNGLSKADFAYSYSSFLKHNKFNTKLISVDDLNFCATRPKGMMMDVSKFERLFDIQLPTLESEIESYLKEK